MRFWQKKEIEPTLAQDQINGIDNQDILPNTDDGIPVLDEDQFPENPPSQQFLSLTFMKRFRVIVFDHTEDKLMVAMADPYDLNTIEIIQTTHLKPVELYRASEELIAQFVYRWYEAEVDMKAGKTDDDSIGMSLEDHLWDNPEQLKDIAQEAPVIRLVNHLISKAYGLGASDIHLEPRRNAVQVRFRIDGVLHDQEVLSGQLKPAITSRIKLMAKMDIAERRLPQDGRIKFKLGRDEIDIRASSIPVHFGESIVLRLLYKEGIQLELESMGFPEAYLPRFKTLISLPYGMLLVTGPTGSGKTTTLYGALNTINSPDKKIVTVEDPVEYQMDGVNQVQVHSGIGLTFASCLRSFLRHDPDVMLVGEIRDTETAEIAIQAALTGHMVFSTLHTNDAAGAVVRLEDMGVERFMIASSLVGVLAQRLVRRVCMDCAEKHQVSEDEKKLIANDLEISPELVGDTFHRGKGCKICGLTGYRGRVGIFELLSVDEAVQREIVKGSDRNRIFKKAVEQGMISLRRDGIEKVKKGITTYEEVMRVTR
ncbi:MAG: type II/IV secretion system protein [Desulfobacterales bacterium]|nr:type II/IV secretion system protein [Desulfobacterales bacterium]